VIVRYLPIRVAQPIPSLGGSRYRYRPLMPVRLTGPSNTRVRDGLLDTGADDTVFEESLAGLLGVDLQQAEERLVGLAGRPQPVRCRYAPVLLRITDGVQETYEWTAVVAFVAGRLHYNLLGHAGFLQFFDANFRGDDHEADLTPKPSFPGRRI
jgi:hypothetical protein